MARTWALFGRLCAAVVVAVVTAVCRAASPVARWGVSRVGRPVAGWVARQVTYFPWLAYILTRCGRAARTVVSGARRVVAWRAWVNLGRAVSGSVRAMIRCTATVTRAVARVARRALCAVWRWARPCVLDAAGWLVHTAPGLLARLLWRAVKATPGVVWWLVLNSSVATVWLLVKLTRYVSGYTDFAGVVALAKEEGRVKQEARLRKKWRETAWTRLGITAVLLIAATLTVSVLADRYGLIVHWGLGAVYTVVMALVGRKLRGPGEEPTPEEIERAEGEPFPIADAHTRAEAADCVARAVRAEGIDLRMAGDAARQPWGWQVPIILRRGTPAAVVAKLGELETTLDLPSGGLLAAPDRARRARVVLRLAERDPFASLPAAVNRPPASGSLVDSHVVARRMDGSDLALNLLGANTVVIGVPGSGKSQTLRALADAVSACEDGVVWDLDPSGNGLEALGGGVSRRERDHAGIEDALADAVALAEARPKMLTGLSMGDAWEVSHERPGVVVFIDEYPQLTDRAKTLAVSLLRLGRKARVTLVLAAAEATSDTLGAAIADSAACKILMPCRHADVRLVLGSNMLAEGWRPDRLNPATGESVEDAGKAYVYAAGAREPLIVKFRPLDGDRAREQGSHRAAVGLPCIDADSWTAARARRTAAADITGVSAGTVQVSDVDGLGVVDLLTACDGEDRLWTDEILSRLATLATRYGGWDAEDLAALIRPLGVGPGQIKREGRNRNGYDLRAVRQAWDTHRRRGPA